MRLWSLHPSYLDAKGLVACWRETLLAQKVLQGRTSGYRNHPQLTRFRETPDPVAVVGDYLAGLLSEAGQRGYRFNAELIAVPPIVGAPSLSGSISVTDGQLAHEWEHLLAKLSERDPQRHRTLSRRSAPPVPHPLFTVAPGPIAAWEVLRPG